MIYRTIRGTAFGFVGMFVGSYAVGQIAQAFQIDRSVIGLIAGPIGIPLGFTLGVIFGFRERKPKEA